jgi:hypothetical protein
MPPADDPSPIAVPSVATAPAPFPIAVECPALASEPFPAARDAAPAEVDPVPKCSLPLPPPVEWNAAADAPPEIVADPAVKPPALSVPNVPWVPCTDAAATVPVLVMSLELVSFAPTNHVFVPAPSSFGIPLVEPPEVKDTMYVIASWLNPAATMLVSPAPLPMKLPWYVGIGGAA